MTFIIKIDDIMTEDMVKGNIERIADTYEQLKAQGITSETWEHPLWKEQRKAAKKLGYQIYKVMKHEDFNDRDITLMLRAVLRHLGRTDINDYDERLTEMQLDMLVTAQYLIKKVLDEVVSARIERAKGEDSDE